MVMFVHTPIIGTKHSFIHTYVGTENREHMIYFWQSEICIIHKHYYFDVINKKYVNDYDDVLYNF